MELAPGRWHTGGMKTPRSINSFAEIATARIALEGADPPIWREVELPTSITLKVLHDIVQATMGWMDYHLWEFGIDGRTYGLPDDEDWGTAPRKEAAKVRLRDVLKPGETVITYTYDFGDDCLRRPEAPHGAARPHHRHRQSARQNRSRQHHVQHAPASVLGESDGRASVAKSTPARTLGTPNALERETHPVARRQKSFSRTSNAGR
jgi:hypothetical protein